MNILIQLPYGGDWVSADQVKSVVAGTLGIAVKMHDDVVHIINPTPDMTREELRDKFAAQINHALQTMAAPHLRINPDGFATAHSARWHYPAAGELAPPGAILQLLTKGGVQVQGIWRDNGSYIAWAPNLKRDRTLEAEHGISTVTPTEGNA